MIRLRQPQVEAVSEALRHIPRRLHDKLGHDLFCADPIFAGVFAPSVDGETSDDGRSYRHIACVGWPFHTRDKRSTIIWPSVEGDPYTDLYTAVHELGHILHGHLADRDEWSRMPLLYSVTRYATTNYMETFAEAFTAWVLYSPRHMDDDRYWPWGYSRHNAEWFDRL